MAFPPSAILGVSPLSSRKDFSSCRYVIWCCLYGLSVRVCATPSPPWQHNTSFSSSPLLCVSLRSLPPRSKNNQVGQRWLQPSSSRPYPGPDGSIRALTHSSRRVFTQSWCIMQLYWICDESQFSALPDRSRTARNHIWLFCAAAASSCNTWSYCMCLESNSLS